MKNGKLKNYLSKVQNTYQIIENEKQKYERQNIGSNEWIDKFRGKKSITELSRDIMMELIDCIYVHENGNITIKFMFEDEFKRCQEYIENNKSESTEKFSSRKYR